MRVAVIVGTRPEIIKMSPVVKELSRQEIDYFILHTGQHYSYNMDQTLFKELGLPQPSYMNLPENRPWPTRLRMGKVVTRKDD